MVKKWIETINIIIPTPGPKVDQTDFTKDITPLRSSFFELELKEIVTSRNDDEYLNQLQSILIKGN